MVFTEAPSKAQGRALIGLTVVFMVLPFPFVFLRIWARRLAGVRLAINDYLILVALVFSTGLGIDLIVGSVLAGYLTGGEDVTPSRLTGFAKAVFSATVLWPTANVAVKLAFLHFYHTIFSAHTKTRYATYFVAFVSIGYWLGAVLTAFTLCTPFAYNWDKKIHAHCGNAVASYLAVAIVNLLADAMIIALPMPMVWSLRLRTSRKVALTFIFGLGAIICIISIARCVAIASLTSSHSERWEILDDITTIMEPTLGIINSSLPILGPISRKLFPRSPDPSAQSETIHCTPDRLGSSHESPMPEKKRPRHNTLTTSLKYDSFDADDTTMVGSATQLSDLRR